MSEAPRVTVRGPVDDVLGEEHATEPTSGARRLLSLGMAAAVGFGLAQVVPPLGVGDEARASASLALVTGRQPSLDAAGTPPVPSLEVFLVNAGPEKVRLLGGEIPGTGLRWAANRPLEPGKQAAVVLQEEGACDRPSDALSAPGPDRRLTVRLEDHPEQQLSLGPVVGRLYDDHVRNVCGLPRLPDALELPTEGVLTTDAAVEVAFGLVNRSVRPLRLLRVEEVPGLDLALTDAAGRPVVLPLAVPASTREQLAAGLPFGDPLSTPYRLRISATGARCPDLQAATNGGDTAVRIVYEGDEEPGVTAERPILAPLGEYARRLCG